MKSRNVSVGALRIKWICFYLSIALILFLSFNLIQKMWYGRWKISLFQTCNSYGDSFEKISVQELIEGVAQDDERLLSYIRRKHLTPPSSLNYNLTKPNEDPGDAIGQNRIVKQILGNMRGGFFVDAGAHDGEYISNTLGFERDYGWSGLLVEPSPIELPNLRNKNRKAWIANVCVAPSTQPSTLEYLHRVNYTIASKLGKEEEIGAYGDYWKLYKVPCFPIFSLLSALKVNVVDYFSLDVEGVELKVLKTIPFESILIKVISVEYNLIPEGKEALVKFLASKNYSLAQEVYHDYIFVHNSLNYKRKS